MARKVLSALIFVFAAATVSSAQNNQNWAEKMFPDGVAHDFGVVPHGAQLFHRFNITNIYAVRMEITSITPGCGCITATAGKRVLEPNEKTTLDVGMDAAPVCRRKDRHYSRHRRAGVHLQRRRQSVGYESGGRCFQSRRRGFWRRGSRPGGFPDRGCRLRRAA